MLTSPGNSGGSAAGFSASAIVTNSRSCSSATIGSNRAPFTVKAQPVEAELNPPADRQDWQGRWARPLEFSGESSAGGGRLALGRGPLADELELLDPARRVFARTHGCVVDLLIEVGLLAREQHIDLADHLVRHRDDGLLVRLAHHQAAVLGRQGALGHSCRIGALCVFLNPEIQDLTRRQLF